MGLISEALPEPLLHRTQSLLDRRLEAVGPGAVLSVPFADFGRDREARGHRDSERSHLVEAGRLGPEEPQADVRVQLCVKRIQKGHDVATLSQAGGSAQCH